MDKQQPEPQVCAACGHFEPRTSTCWLFGSGRTVDKPACEVCPLWRKRGR